MAITNFGELKAKLSRYEFHQRFAPDYADVTTLFENAANRRLRVLPMEAMNIFQTVTGEAPVPPDYLAWRTVLWIRGGVPTTGEQPPYEGIELDYVHPAYFRSTGINRGEPPSIFTIEGDTFRGRPVAIDNDTVDTYEFHYYQKIPTITGSDGSNWLLDAWPDVYLFGVLTELAALGRNVEMAQLYKARRDEVFAEIIRLYSLTTGATSSKVRAAEYF